MVAAQGTLGENEVFCQPILVTGRWLDFAYTQHFLRILSGDPTFPGAFLFAFLRSEAVFRCFRSMSIGSKQQDLHPASDCSVSCAYLLTRQPHAHCRESSSRFPYAR